MGRLFSRFLEREAADFEPWVAQDFDALCQTIRVGDVLLVEGRARVSSVIKYLTQSTWSHAALCVADMSGPGSSADDCQLVEVTLEEGCHSAALSKYARHNTRLCRPSGLSEAERQAVAEFMRARIGLQYDLRNVFDLARYLLPRPPVPIRFRRRMLALGSGDPTRAICSSLIAKAFQSVRYPILPEIRLSRAMGASRHARREVWHIRHHSLYAPRDFDLSPYFDIVKPALEGGFDHRRINWAPGGKESAA
ncbi:MAG: lipo-like protein [Pararhodobacter sp.]|nr:lipo-like protein [Pararhodobacter sp.]